MSKPKKMIALEQENKELKNRLAKSQKANLVYSNLLYKKSNYGKVLGFTLHKRKTGKTFKWYASKRIHGNQKWVYVGKDSALAKEKIETWLSKHFPFHHVEEEKEKPLTQEDFSMTVLELEDKAKELLEKAQSLCSTIPARFTDKAYWESIRDDIERELEKSAQMEYLLSQLSEIQEKQAYKYSVKVKLWLLVERNSKFVRGKKKVTEEIEFYVLQSYNMKKLADGNYELTIPYDNEKELERIIDEIFIEMHNTADMRHCFVEADMTEIGGDRYWS